MPLYEYRCEVCGSVIEVIQRFSDAPLELHESCGGRLEKLISASAFQFKGSGFYITDYARGNGGKKLDAGAGSGTQSESKSDGKSDSGKSDSGKSETKSDSKSESKSDAKPAPAATTSSEKKSSEKKTG